MFNTLKYAKKLEEVGFTREQAETHIQIMSEIVDTNLATKQDMLDLRVEIHHDFERVRQETDRRFDEFDNRLLQLEYRLTIKLGTMLSIAVGVMAAIVKLA